MTAFRTILLCAFATFVAGGATFAQNLLTNSDFDTGVGLDAWTWGPGSLALEGDSGSCLLSDAALATSAMAASNQYFAMYSTQCIPVDGVAIPTLQIGALYRTTAPVWARLFAQTFSDAACTQFLDFSGPVYGSTSAAWTAIGGAVTLDPLTLGVKFTADFNPMAADTPQFTGSFDRFYLGVLPQLLVDGFEAESGSACHWSQVVP